MELLHFDQKQGKEYNPDIPSCSASARIHGGMIIVDSPHASLLQCQGSYGHELGERQDRIISRVFGDPTNVLKNSWTEKRPKNQHLLLSPEEVAFLSIENNILKVFMNGECLTTVIYREGPENYHASAGVRIETDIALQELTALNRALFNVKKALISAKVTIPPLLDTSTPSCLSQVNVQFITTTTFFPEQQTFSCIADLK